MNLAGDEGQGDVGAMQRRDLAKTHDFILKLMVLLGLSTEFGLNLV